MSNAPTPKQVIGILTLLFVLLVPVFLYLHFNKTTPVNIQKSYLERPFLSEVNEYENLAVTHKQTARLYYAEYLNLLRFDPDKAYQKLTATCKKKSYPNYQEFITLASSNLFSDKITNITTMQKDDILTYTVYDEKRKSITFIADAIMDYQVCF